MQTKILFGCGLKDCHTYMPTLQRMKIEQSMPEFEWENLQSNKPKKQNNLIIII